MACFRDVDKRHSFPGVMLDVKILAAEMLSGQETSDRPTGRGDVRDDLNFILRFLWSRLCLLVLGTKRRDHRRQKNEKEQITSSHEALLIHWLIPAILHMRGGIPRELGKQ